MIGDDACALKHTPHSTVQHCLCVLGKRSSPLDHAAGEHERACALLWCGNHTPEGGSAFQPPLCPQQSTPLPIALRRAPRATSEVVGLELCGGVLLRVRLPIRRHQCRLCPYLTARRSPGPAAVHAKGHPTYGCPPVLHSQRPFFQPSAHEPAELSRSFAPRVRPVVTSAYASFG